MLRSIDTCQNKVSADQYHMTISRAQVYSSSKSRVFWSCPLTKCWLSIGSWAHITLTCWKQGRIARKPVNANPGLKVNQIITFSSIQMFFLLFCFLYRVIIKTQNGRPNNIQKNLTAKLQNSNQNSTSFGVSLIWLWTTWPRSYAFRLT